MAAPSLALCNHAPNTCLWELCGIDEPPDVDAHCYEPMDQLLRREGAIQRGLARRHLDGGPVVLYDITSIYFEGDYGIEQVIFVGDRGMSTAEVVNAYKSLPFVERAFRTLKTAQLEIRPVYHKTDERIRSHVFLCMLAYYLQLHMEQRLTPLFAADGQGPERRWTFRGVIDCLAQITRNKVTVNGAEFYQTSTPTPEQEEILNLLQVAM